jgi:hypothetical protein
MPMSSTEGKSWILERVQAAAADRALDVLDIGPGVGTYAKLLAGAQVASLVAIEIFEPYVHTYRLGDYYDQVLIGDARTTPFPDTDIVILGDVAEHMSAHDAVALWQKAATAARVAVYLRSPGSASGGPVSRSGSMKGLSDKAVTAYLRALSDPSGARADARDRVDGAPR